MRNSCPRKVWAAYDVTSSCVNQVLTNFGRTTSGDGHVVASYARVIRTGFRGLIDQARAHLDTLDLRQPEHLERKLFCQAVITTLEAAIAFAARYAGVADQLAATETDPARAAELHRIAAICRRVPAEPARTFHEALQFCWLLQLLIQIESDGHSISLGRFDQVMHPYYAADTVAGRLTRSDALELIECFLAEVLRDQ